MPRPVSVAERAMEVQVAADELWRAVVTTNDFILLSEARALCDLLRTADKVAKRIAKAADGAVCPDEPARKPGHGRAA